MKCIAARVENTLYHALSSIAEDWLSKLYTHEYLETKLPEWPKLNNYFNIRRDSTKAGQDPFHHLENPI
jgi:hypothetical protein